MNPCKWLVILLLLTGLLMRGNLKGNKKYVFIAFLMMFVIIGLRDVYTIGCDSATSYLHGFERMADTAWNAVRGHSEMNANIGFAYLMKLGYVATHGDYQMFIALLSAFFMISYAHFIGKYSPSPLQSVLYFLGLLYFTFVFDALKQATAMCILLFAFDAIIDRKPIKFLILTLIAAGFHYPALVFLPAYWISKMNVGKNFIGLLALLLLVTFIFRDAMLNLMLGSYGGESIDASMDGVAFLRTKTIVMIVIVIVAYFLRPLNEDDMVYSTLLKFAGIAIVFQTFCGYNNIFERLADYYFHFCIVLIPLMFETGVENNSNPALHTFTTIKLVAPVMFSAYAVWRFWDYIDISMNLSHYIFCFQK